MTNTRQRYVILLANVLDTRWSDYFENEDTGISLVERRDGMHWTRIAVSVVDQAELIGMVDLLHDFGMKIERVVRLHAIGMGTEIGVDSQIGEGAGVPHQPLAVRVVQDNAEPPFSSKQVSRSSRYRQ